MPDVALSTLGKSESAPFSVSVDSVPSLVERASMSPQPTELVVTAVRPHRRALRDQLRAADLPQSSFRFGRLTEVARQVAGTSNAQTEALDRIDRLREIQGLLEEKQADDTEWYTNLATSMGTDLASRPEAVEALRAEVETLTGFHPSRLGIIQQEATTLETPANLDAEARIDGAVALQQLLTDSADEAASRDAIVRTAIREITTHGGDVWDEAYGTIDRFTVAGVATISTTLADFLRVVAEETDIEVELHLRSVTGPILRDRLPDLCSISDPGAEVIEG